MVLIPYVRFVIIIRTYSFGTSSCLLAGDWYNYAASQGRQVVRDDRCGTNQTDFVTPEYATYPARLVCVILTACAVWYSSSACSRKSGRVAKGWTLSATDTIRTREDCNLEPSILFDLYVIEFRRPPDAYQQASEIIPKLTEYAFISRGDEIIDTFLVAWYRKVATTCSSESANVRGSAVVL